MSWSFSRGLVAAFLEANCSDTGPSAPSNTTPTPDQFYWPDKPTEHSRLSRFGMTCEPLTGNRGAELLTWYLAGFPARTSASPETVPGLTGSAPDCGEKWPASLAKYDPASHSLKTAQLSLLADLTGCSPILPRSGLMRAGECWELPMLERRIKETVSGYWPTPVASDTGDRKAKYSQGGTPLSMAAKTWPTPRSSDRNGPGLHGIGGMDLRTAVAMWPTPTVCGNNNRKGVSKTIGDGLATAVKTRTYPTATATAYKGWSPNHNRAATDDRLDYTVEREAFNPGQQTPPMRLNPDWVEYLMGWPIGHTALKPLATDRFREFERQHGECLEAAE